MKTVGEILKLTQDCFKEKGIGRARRTAEELVRYVLHLSRMELYLHYEKPLIEKEIEQLRLLVKRKLKGEPLEYLVQTLSFYQCTLLVTQGVLIPRPETEILLDKICSRLKTLSLENKCAWDLCTGSGCLGIGLKKTFPQLSVTLSDLSSKALAIARHNAQANGVDVLCLEGDLLEPFRGQTADFILCNPPYVSSKDYEHLDPSVRLFEPREALWAGEEGLFFYKRLSAELGPYVKPGTLLFLEIGKDQGKAVYNLFFEQGWKILSLEKDWAGHDRFFFLER